MKPKRYFGIALPVCLCMLLCSCSGQVPVSATEPTLTLPPVEQKYSAPVGDAALEYTQEALLYLPRYDGNVLGSALVPVSFSAARPQAESLVRALLSQPETGTLSSLGGGVKLSLYGVNPVEQSRNVVTVNLGASALQMDRKALYIACQAITNTVTELPQIDYVNFLVVDRAIGLDVANTLPMGAFCRSIGTDVGAAYDQLMQRRVDVTQSAAEKPLAADVTLYFPLAHTSGILSEVRSCAFSNQLPEDMVVMLLQEMAKGSLEDVPTPPLPLLGDLLTEQPKITETEESGKLIELSFAYNLDEMLAANSISRSACMASLSHTLCTFFPGISGISVSIGDQPVETLQLTDQLESTITFQKGVQKRTDFAPLLYDLCRLQLMNEDKNALVTVQRPVPYYQAANPRILLQELARGPQRYDVPAETENIMQPGSINDAAIIGLALSEDALVVNLSETFRSCLKDADAQSERLLAYAMTNTLCASTNVEKVQFYVNGKPFEGFSGDIFWETSFSPLY